MNATETTTLPRAAATRFFEKVDQAGSCWIWTGSLAPNGYGQFWLDGAVRQAHRVAYEAAVGPIPDGWEVDHLCFTRPCVNPAHLEAVTPAENKRRSAARITHCPHGHEYTPENTAYSSNGKGSMGRKCRTCRNRWFRENDRARKGRGNRG